MVGFLCGIYNSYKNTVLKKTKWNYDCIYISEKNVQI